MNPVFSTHLEARDPERNRWRSYRVEAGQDLFGMWVGLDLHTCRELACTFCLVFDFRHREIERSERSGLDPGQFAMVRPD